MLAVTRAQEPSSGWMHRAYCLYVMKRACSHTAGGPHLVPLFLHRIYTIDTWQPKVFLPACTLDRPSPVTRYLDHKCPCLW